MGLLRPSARLVPAERRAWVEALWAEAGQAPAGLARLTWWAGGLRLIAREALPARRAARALVFVAAAAWVAYAAWPGPGGNPATALNRLNVVTLLPVLAGLPPGGGGPPGPPGHPAPDPPGGIRLAAAGADGRPVRLPGLAEGSPYGAEPALPRAG
jgi:hypothetical protein